MNGGATQIFINESHLSRLEEGLDKGVDLFGNPEKHIPIPPDLENQLTEAQAGGDISKIIETCAVALTTLIPAPADTLAPHATSVDALGALLERLQSENRSTNIIDSIKEQIRKLKIRMKPKKPRKTGTWSEDFQSKDIGSASVGREIRGHEHYGVYLGGTGTQIQSIFTGQGGHPEPTGHGIVAEIMRFRPDERLDSPFRSGNSSNRQYKVLRYIIYPDEEELPDNRARSLINRKIDNIVQKAADATTNQERVVIRVKYRKRQCDRIYRPRNPDIILAEVSRFHAVGSGDIISTVNDGGQKFKQ